MMDAALSNRFRNMALLSACLVVTIHCSSHIGVTSALVRSVLEDGVCRIAVPFFFFASGYFLSKHVGETGWWKRALVSRLRTLAVPYLIFVSVYWLFRNSWYMVMNIRSGANAFDGIDVSMPAILGIFGFNPFDYPAMAPLWYIRALLILIVLTPLLVRYKRVLLGRVGLLMLFIIYGLIAPWEHGGGVQNSHAHNFFRICFALRGLFYMGVGFSFGLGEINCTFKSKRISFTCFFVGLCMMSLKVLTEMNGLRFYPYLGWVACPFLMFGTFNLMTAAEIPGWLSSCAFPVYLFHMLIVSSVTRVLGLLGYNQGLPVGIFAACDVGIVLLSLAIVVLQRKLIPCLNGVLYGGR